MEGPRTAVLVRPVWSGPVYRSYAVLRTGPWSSNHGVLHGGFDGKHDAVTICADVPLDREAADEGLHRDSFVQAVTCQRRVLTKVYENNEPCKFKKHQ